MGIIDTAANKVYFRDDIIRLIRKLQVRASVKRSFFALAILLGMYTSLIIMANINGVDIEIVDICGEIIILLIVALPILGLSSSKSMQFINEIKNGCDFKITEGCIILHENYTFSEMIENKYVVNYFDNNTEAIYNPLTFGRTIQEGDDVIVLQLTNITCYIDTVLIKKRDYADFIIKQEG